MQIRDLKLKKKIGVTTQRKMGKKLMLVMVVMITTTMKLMMMFTNQKKINGIWNLSKIHEFRMLISTVNFLLMVFKIVDHAAELH